MNKFGNLFLPNKISSSHAYDKSDYVKEKVVLSSQPSATCNLLIDLIIKLPKEINEINKSKIEEFLHKGKIAGGKINVANNVRVDSSQRVECAIEDTDTPQRFHLLT